jgi:hypothetical protein
MKSTLSLRLVALLATCATCAASASLAACASSAPNDGALGSTVSQAATAPADIAALSGTWVFALAASDVAAAVDEGCTAESSNDPAVAKECREKIQKQAAREKIRFGKDEAGHTVWTSFESDAGNANEKIYVAVPVELAADGPGHVLAKITGTPKGEMAARFAKHDPKVMRIEVVDARTIAMVDPKKGRLVYTKE